VISGATAYRAFKYSIFALLAINVALFLFEDSLASAQTFTDGVSWRNVVEAYSQTVDTIAWLLLLLMFELETSTIPDDKLKGPLVWMFAGVRALCYAFIVYSCYGYISKFFVVTDVLPFAVENVCSLVGSEFTYARTLDEYFPLTPQICQAMQDLPLQRVAGTNIIGTPEQISLLRSLALTDVINSVDWILVVAVLESEVWLQLRGLLTSRIMLISRYVKSVLYTVLLGCAVYWWIDGDFLDFWDAFLWLVAFVFIDLNIFKWQTETTLDAQQSSVAGAGSISQDPA